MDNQFFRNTGMPPLDQPTMPTWHTLSAMETQSSDHDFPAPATQPSGYFFQPEVCNSGVSNQCFAIRELIGNLGNVCNSDEISPLENHPVNRNTLTVNTPITHHANSISIPPFGSNLPAMPGDPGFSDRATRLSYFGSRSFNGRTGNFVCPNSSDFPSNSTTLIVGGKLHRVSSSPSVNGSPQIAENMNLESSISTGLEYTHPGGETWSQPGNDGSSSSRKRKSPPNEKCNEIPRPSSAKVVESGENSNAKRSKLSEGSNGNKKEQKLEDEEEDDEIKKQNVNITNQNPPEPSKDYIHVRARRGQATDSHSLAERVRREKIGERMTLLQDLVPGCNKVTGKALMLEEIINYVQSLQRQVEFLSMKVACVNPRLDFNTDNLFQKDIYQTNCSIQTQPIHPLDTLAPSLYGANSLQQNGITISGVGPPCSNPTDPINQTHDLQLPTLDVLNNGVPKSCEGDLHTIVQMSFGQSNKALQDNTFLQGSNQTSSMKIEF